MPARSRLISTPITRAPKWAPRMVAPNPTGPSPKTPRVWPPWTPPAFTGARYGVPTQSPIKQPTSKETESGNGRQARSGIRTYSASPPSREKHHSSRGWTHYWGTSDRTYNWRATERSWKRPGWNGRCVRSVVDETQPPGSRRAGPARRRASSPVAPRRPPGYFWW